MMDDGVTSVLEMQRILDEARNFVIQNARQPELVKLMV